MSLGIPLLSVDEVRELGGVSDEEDRGIVEHPVPVTLVCPELGGEPTRIASGVGRSRLATNGGETHRHSDLFADRAQERLRGDVTEVVSHLEVSMSSSTFCVDLMIKIDKRQ